MPDSPNPSPTVAQRVHALEDRVRLERTKAIRGEQKFDRVVGMLLRGEKVCIRCWMHEAHHIPGPPTPPQTKGHLGATGDKPAICDHFEELTLERWEAGDGTGTIS